MIRIDFPQRDIKKIKQLRDHDPHPRVRRRMDVLWLKSQGLPHQEICRLTGISSNTLRKYLRRYQAGGVEKLLARNFYTPTSELDQHRVRLEVHFRAHPPATLKEAMAAIEQAHRTQAQPQRRGKVPEIDGYGPETCEHNSL